MLLFCHRWHPTQIDRGFALRRLYVQPAPLVHRCPLHLGVRVSWLQMWTCKTDWWDVVTFNHRNGMMICTDIQFFQGDQKIMGRSAGQMAPWRSAWRSKSLPQIIDSQATQATQSSLQRKGSAGNFYAKDRGNSMTEV